METYSGASVTPDTDNPIQQSFDLMHTVHFEKVMAACETSALIARAHGLDDEQQVLRKRQAKSVKT